MERLNLYKTEHKLKTINDKAERHDFLETLIHKQISSFHNHFPQFDLKELPLILKLEPGVGGGSRSKFLRSENDLERIKALYKGKLSEDQLRSLLNTPNKEKIVKVFASNLKGILEIYYDQYGFWYDEYEALNEQAPNGSICSLIVASDAGSVFKVPEHKSADKHGYQIVFNNYPFDVWIDGKYLYQSLPHNKRNKLLDTKCSNNIIALVDQLLEMDYRELEEDLSRCKTSEERRGKLDFYLEQLKIAVNANERLKDELFNEQSIEVENSDSLASLKTYLRKTEDNTGHELDDISFFAHDVDEYEIEVGIEGHIMSLIVKFLRNINELYKREYGSNKNTDYFDKARSIYGTSLSGVDIQKICLYFVLLTNKTVGKKTRDASREAFLKLYNNGIPPKLGKDTSSLKELFERFHKLLHEIPETASTESIRKYWNKDYFGIDFYTTKNNSTSKRNKIEALRRINEWLINEQKLFHRSDNSEEIIKTLKKVGRSITSLEGKIYTKLFTDMEPKKGK